MFGEGKLLYFIHCWTLSEPRYYSHIIIALTSASNVFCKIRDAALFFDALTGKERFDFDTVKRFASRSVDNRIYGFLGAD